MTHPHTLHATRAAQALTDARHHLDQAVSRERAQRYAEARITAAASAIQAWRPVPGPSGKGGHGDPASRAAVNHLEPEWRDGHLARLAASTMATLAWLAGALRLPDSLDPLHTLTAAIPGLRPSTARELTLWIDEADQRIREALHLDPDGQALPGLRCPRCARRQLLAHTTGPRPTWTITCTDSCVCAGDTCPCRMPVRITDLPHIWGPDHPLTTTLTSHAA